ncbi:putative integral membrane protein (TIGR00698 family) [Breznakia sp. PF5-3]|uniref:YeiH family protein n=1 Tax=unclassified Breznakia TaxID=2623764 RepID=UPI002405F8F5|nr:MULTISPECIES: YeiH family protein [unclassified Breznakia]MDF9824171.1 putative integral membrane protein (TIGR00698 family) [Breznakia sp. PM6-1]MDF9834969.1 putative integral membrane protein (TIGR00698 family) [Breznakia sp. PF5-3]MDF9837162.1 putative integral membrane protein (TIGR00698 family) [Breznakia sp. PFB2-8]MDF9859152.1 putative integral membrane protein (TIGR00698 family) [Breznakia sp. PH5-24]
MKLISNNWQGILFCLALAIPSYFLGNQFPIIGGPVIAIVSGMILAIFIKNKNSLHDGVKYTSKKILQYAVILLGFGMNLEVVVQTGKQSLPIIICTISTSLVIAYVLHRTMKIPKKISTLIGVGSSICGGSAIAATAPVIDADEEEIAQAISVIFLFNIIAALIFPMLGNAIGFSTSSGDAFGVFAGTAVNDTSSVSASASTWDSMHNLGSQTLDKAITVKLTRTLAIIPITLFLAFRRSKNTEATNEKKASIKNAFPFFILLFIFASFLTTIATSAGISEDVFVPMKFLSKFFIIMAMGAIGFNTDVVKLIKSGIRPILLGMSCWIGITIVSLVMQYMMNIW